MDGGVSGVARLARSAHFAAFPADRGHSTGKKLDGAPPARVA
jgi:hypothetical protein